MAQALDLSSLPAEILSGLLFDPDRIRILEQQKRPLSDHLADYHSYRATKPTKRGKTISAQHLHDSTRRLRVMVRLCRARIYSDLDEMKIQRALGILATLRKRPGRRVMGLATVNHYLTSLDAFCQWMCGKARRAVRNPCDGVEKYNAAEDVRHARRALTPQQVLSLIAAANSGRPVGGISGAERAMGYLIACTSGLRSAELQSLMRSSFVLDDPKGAYMRVKASKTKNGKEAVLPLSPDVVRLVRAFLDQVGRDDQVIRRPKNGIRALRQDLAAAGIPYVLDGQFADFHSLRHTFVSTLFDSGATAKEVQTLARHSDPRLTLGIYSHVTAGAQRAAVERLPFRFSDSADRMTRADCEHELKQTRSGVWACKRCGASGTWVDGMIRWDRATDRVG